MALAGELVPDGIGQYLESCHELTTCGISRPFIRGCFWLSLKQQA